MLKHASLVVISVTGGHKGTFQEFLPYLLVSG